MSKDYYKVLGVEKTATQDEIKSAYKKLAKQYHPDINKDSSASEKFKEINEAAAVLGDAEKRSHFDQHGTAPGQGFQGFNYNDFAQGFDFDSIFDSFFGGGVGGRMRGGGRRQGPTQGRDLAYDIDITLEEAYRGTTHTVPIDKYDTCKTCKGKGGDETITCPQCRGTGSVQQTKRTPFGIFATTSTCGRCKGAGEAVSNPCKNCGGAGREEVVRKVEFKIPAGVEDGMRLRVPGEGEAGERGARTGDLYVLVHVKEHSSLQREGADLYTAATIPFITACLGGEVEVQTIDGATKIEVPEGTQPETLLRIKGKGMPTLHGSHGNLHVRMKVQIPTKLSKKQKELLKEFGKEKKGWF